MLTASDILMTFCVGYGAICVSRDVVSWTNSWYCRFCDIVADFHEGCQSLKGIRREMNRLNRRLTIVPKLEKFLGSDSVDQCSESDSATGSNILTVLKNLGYYYLGLATPSIVDFLSNLICRYSHSSPVSSQDNDYERYPIPDNCWGRTKSTYSFVPPMNTYSAQPDRSLCMRTKL